MKYFLRLALYMIIFAAVFSVSCVVVLRVIPITVTPVKVVKLFEHGLSVKSNWAALPQISTQMQRAVIATEDNNFIEHHGFDFAAIKKAIAESRRGERLRGASTISQQTAKNVFCTPSRTWLRKGVESWYTILIELLWGKRRIMEAYLNVIEVHPGMYGAEAAARSFYDTDALHLNNYQAAMIATVLPNPARMDIGNPSRYMVGRAARVRGLMQQVAGPDYKREKQP